jgi:hypothetical protein
MKVWFAVSVQKLSVFSKVPVSKDFDGNHMLFFRVLVGKIYSNEEVCYVYYKAIGYQSVGNGYKV